MQFWRAYDMTVDYDGMIATDCFCSWKGYDKTYCRREKKHIQKDGNAIQSS